MSEWQPIESVPIGKRVLLWIHLEQRPANSDVILGEVTRKRPSEFWISNPIVLLELQDDVSLSEGSIWDGNVYRPMWATHWMPRPAPPVAYIKEGEQ